MDFAIEHNSIHYVWIGCWVRLLLALLAIAISMPCAAFSCFCCSISSVVAVAVVAAFVVFVREARHVHAFYNVLHVDALVVIGTTMFLLSWLLPPPPPLLMLFFACRKDCETAPGRHESVMVRVVHTINVCAHVSGSGSTHTHTHNHHLVTGAEPFSHSVTQKCVYARAEYICMPWHTHILLR